MKKSLFSVIAILVVVFMFSCRKNYHCQCAYNNSVVYSKDLGIKSSSDAQSACSAYDTTVPGEKWQCTIY